LKLTIHKFELRRIGEPTILRLPPGAMATRIDLQDGRPHAWVLLDADAGYTVDYDFLIVRTGWSIPPGYWLVNTFLDGPHALHGLSRILPDEVKA
jgi:hypothetical protein